MQSIVWYKLTETSADLFIESYIHLFQFRNVPWDKTESWDSVVCIATGYRLDDRGVGFRVLVGPKIFSSPRHPDRLWGSPSLLSSGYRGSFPGCKAAGAWNWPLTSKECRGQENVDLYVHPPPNAFMA
jgi:hypothetical protein